ncbi:hypothetical protein KAJ83_03080 [Marivibrio halodurans]|uniref:Metallo-beta-lactamase domain-containing protein n=1 Tax=Marivibrio halodurans TaxID=2039722 RepID=A0A8J7UZS1_9PROT|nr:hypothetical protein [Marivibrio halodurans]MBP5855976.1 hypothetical protein [Marivibrio halodurans]
MCKEPSSSSSHPTAAARSRTTPVSVPLPPPEILMIHHLDVGQGEATLVIFMWYDGGYKKDTVLIDGGRTTRGGGTVSRYLKELQIDYVDVAICTHYDQDHMEGVAAVLGDTDLTVGQVCHRGALDSHKATLLRNAIGDIPASRLEKHQGFVLGPDTLDTRPQLRCVHSSPHPTEGDDNPYCIAIGVSYGEFRYYLGGDLDSPNEDTVDCTTTILNDADAIAGIKCSHHGSRKSTSATFLGTLKPMMAVISAGAHSYCHPDDDVIARLCAAGSVQRFYLTNCCYNRAGINPIYALQKSIEQISSELRYVSLRIEVLEAIRDYNRAKRANPHDPALAGLRATVMEINKRRGKAKRAFDAIKALPDTDTRTRKGIVAGSPAHLGGVVVEVTSREADRDDYTFRVGCYQTGNSFAPPQRRGWRWDGFKMGTGRVPVSNTPDLGRFQRIGDLEADASTNWHQLVSELRGVEYFSLPTKPAGAEPHVVAPLSAAERAYALDDPVSSDESDGSEYVPSGDESD